MRASILKIDDIILKKELYPRVKPNDRIITSYIKDMEKGDKFPPLYVALYKKKYYLVDGRHRLEAYKSILPQEERFVSCEIKTNFTDFAEMFLASFRANMAHGNRLKQEDKLKVANILSNMKYDIEDISKLTGITLKKVESAVKGKIHHVLIKDKIRSGQLPDVVREKLSNKEPVKIIEDKEIKKIEEANKDEFQLYQLNEIYNYLKKEEFNLEYKGIGAWLKKIKGTLHKRFPKL